MPGRLMSNVYFARPVTLSGPSRRLTEVLRIAGFSGHWYFLISACISGLGGAWPCWFCAGAGACAGAAGGFCGAWGFCALATNHPLRSVRRFEDPDERAAPADVAVETAAHLLGRGV